MRPRSVMDEPEPSVTLSIDRAAALLRLLGNAGANGARLSDLVARSGLAKPTVRRILLALIRAALVDQDEVTRRYQLGPELHVLGALAGSRFGIYALSLDTLARLSRITQDTSFLSVPRDTLSVCLRREEGSFPIRTHALNVGDRHPLGVGAGSLAMLAARPDEEIQNILNANAALLAQQYPSCAPPVLLSLVAETRRQGYALNPGLIVPGSWGVGVAVRGPDGQIAGALSIAAIEARLDDQRRRELAPLLREEAARLEGDLCNPVSSKTIPPSIAPE